MTAPTKESWHLDKKVPLSLIFAMLIQAAMVIWAVADIKKDVEILATAEIEDKAYLTASQENALTAGRVTLAFDREPMRILGWNVVDGSGTVTQVNLISPLTGAPIDKKVFRYQPPIAADNR